MRNTKLIAAAIAFVTHMGLGIAQAGPISDWWTQKHAPQATVVQTPAVSSGVCVDTSACGSCSTCNTGCDPCSAGTSAGLTGAVQPTVVNYAGYGATTAYSATSAYGATTPYSATTANTAAFPHTMSYYAPSYRPAAYNATTAYSSGYAYPQAGYGPFWRLRGLFRNYRSVWAAVPVTTYRPVATVDPTTGAQVTALQPCTTYTWQVRRVPVSSWWPSQTAAYAYAPASYAPVAATGYAQTTVSSGCSSCGDGGYSSTIQSGPTIYAPSASPAPAVTVPAGPAGTVPAETAPADRAPALNPDDLNPGAANRPVQQQPSVRVSRPKADSDLGPDIKPVPDPDAPAAGGPDKPAPVIRNPQDRTAAFPVRQAWAFTPISWPAKDPQPAAVSTATADGTVDHNQQPREDNTAQPIKWDASGWKSVGK